MSYSNPQWRTMVLLTSLTVALVTADAIHQHKLYMLIHHKDQQPDAKHYQ